MNAFRLSLALAVCGCSASFLQAENPVVIIGGISPDSTLTSTAGPARRGPHGSIERLASELDRLIAPGTEMERLADGFDWSEGPTWLAKEKAVVFSDVPVNKIYRWSEIDGLTLYLEPSGYSGNELKFNEQGSNGLTTDKAGKLIICQHGNRQVARLTQRQGTEGTFETVAAYSAGRRFNSPNDLCYARNGDLYFTDPPYGLPGIDKSPAKELMVNGVYLLRPKGEPLLLTGKLSFPNGIALSPDERTLYVNISDPARPVLMAYDVQADGTIARERVFFDTAPLAAQGRKGLPDGLKVDVQGNIWATGPGGVLILSPEGKHLGSLLTGEATGNCAWGDDGSTLYITADMYLLRVKTLTQGHSPWAKK